MDERGLIMNLRNVDLNLLVVLEALLSELHVTRAGLRVGLSQSAMSSALGRLRSLFDDELLIRTAAGMAPTPRALELAAPVQQLLRQTERLLESDSSFNPATSNLHYRLRMSDVLEYLLLPQLLSTLRKEAPGITLDVVHLPPAATISALEVDAIDLAVSMDLDHPIAVRSKPLFRDRMVCLLDKSHPAAFNGMTLEQFLDASHLKVSISPTDGRYADAALSAMRHARRIAVNVPHWLIVPHLLQHSSLIAVISERLAASFVEDRLTTQPLPFPSTGFTWSLYWHRRHDHIPAQRWLRERVDRVVQALHSSGSPQPRARHR